MKTLDEIREWIDGARLEYGDPSVPVGVLFVDYQADAGVRIEYRHNPPELVLFLSADRELPLPFDPDGPVMDGEESLAAYGLERICDSLWQLLPSLNIPCLLHTFVIVYNAPVPAPWERRIWLPGEKL